jgi:glycosyltransferase involved in cell wall biosynthesis
MQNESNLILSVVMITYAHEDFIEQAINGVLMQECKFDIELIIVNDCSPDNTDAVVEDIIKKHPKASWIRYIKHEKNIGMIPNFIFSLNESQGKYIALCEGDDYWTDPLKLQKQVDFLEMNPKFGLVHTNNKVFLQKENKFITESRIVDDVENPFECLIFNCNPIVTLTVCFRKNIIIEYFESLDFQKQSYLLSDYPIWIWFSLKSKIKLINEVTGVYRVLEESASQSKNKQKNIAFVENQRLQALYFLPKHRIIEHDLAFYKKHALLFSRYSIRNKKIEIKKLFFQNRKYLDYVIFELLKYLNSTNVFIRFLNKIQMVLK